MHERELAGGEYRTETPREERARGADAVESIAECGRVNEESMEAVGVVVLTWGSEGSSWAMRSHGDRLCPHGGSAEEAERRPPPPAWAEEVEQGCSTGGGGGSGSSNGGGSGRSNGGGAGEEYSEPSRREADLRIRMARRLGRDLGV
jgi:hypothetical protein